MTVNLSQKGNSVIKYKTLCEVIYSAVRIVSKWSLKNTIFLFKSPYKA